MENGFAVHDIDKNGIGYNGTTAKFGITVDNTNYIVKLQKDGSPSSVYSEYVASRFIASLNIAVHDTWLGSYQNQTVSIIRDFTTPGTVLRSFGDTRQSSEETDIGSYPGYTYNEILHLIDKHIKMGKIVKDKAVDQFWKQFICDAILGNRDRHKGNWGYLTNGRVSYPAPIYDNGGSLFPDVHRVIHAYQRDKQKFVTDRSDYFPASMIKHAAGKGKSERINYFRAINAFKDIPEFSRSLSIFREQLDIHKIVRVTQDVLKHDGNIIPPLYKEFYLSVICTRYLRMIQRLRLDSAYKQALEAIDDETQKNRAVEPE